MTTPVSPPEAIPVQGAAATGTVDITNLVESLRQDFVAWATAFVYGEELAIPGFGEFIALPIVADLDKDVVKAIIDALTRSAVMQVFFVNTAIKKASQAGDYLDTIDAFNNLPAAATTQEVLNAEQNKMQAFRDFVLLTN